jgi:ABC-type sugar transport system ATPase subunit
MENQNENRSFTLETKNITKKFPGVIAVDDVSFKVGYKEIHAIMGENGAGKSTFCNLLTGIYKPDKGDIYLFGKKCNFGHPADSLKAGISMVYQERNLLPFLTGAQNICLGSEPANRFAIIDEKKVYKLADDIRKYLEVDIPLDVPIGKLTPGVQQMIEIIRAFNFNPKLLVLDEPTASLSEGEIGPFFNFIKKAADEMNISIIFISHKIDEVFQLADKISVFADGRKVLTKAKNETTRGECIKAMVRADIKQKIVINNSILKGKEPFLKVGNCDYDGKTHQLNFTAYKGRVTGMYGLIGSGRTECAEAIYGVRPIGKSEIWLNDVKIKNQQPLDMIKKGIILVPEFRSNALINVFNLKENISILFLDKIKNNLFNTLNSKMENDLASSIAKKGNIKYTDINQNIRTLSGGNKQKVVISRSLALKQIELIIMDEPTHGIDLGAKLEIYKLIRKIAEKDNKAVIVISSELPELMSICDNIYIFCNGNITKKFERANFNKPEILKYALGQK